MPRKVFRKSEDNFLRKYYRTKSDAELADLLNASKRTIKYRLEELELQRTSDEEYRLKFRKQETRYKLQVGDIFFKNGTFRIKDCKAGSRPYHEYVYNKKIGIILPRHKVILIDNKYDELSSYVADNLTLKRITVLDKYAMSNY